MWERTRPHAGYAPPNKQLTVVRGNKGSETQEFWPGNLPNTLPPLVLGCATPGSPSSTHRLLGSVTAGPSGPAHHKTDDTTTPKSPQWPSRSSGAHEQLSSPDRAALWAGAGLLYHMAPEASAWGVLCYAGQHSHSAFPCDRQTQDWDSHVTTAHCLRVKPFS